MVADTENAGKLVGRGAVAGIVGGLAMMMFAMMYSLAVGKGFFTPGYHIASFVVGPQAMMNAMESAFYLAPGAFLLGAAIHMMTGALYGVIFALIAWRLRLHGAGAVVVGMLYGLAIVVLMSLVVLPLFPQEEMQNMAAMFGWVPFTVEHAMYGLVLGAWVAWRPEHVAPRTTPGQVRTA